MNPDSADGSFELFYRKGWAYLIVQPPGPGGKPVYPEEVEGRMRMLEVPKVRTKLIRERIEKASGTAEKLVEWPEGSRLAPEIKVSVSEDKMTAWVTVAAPKKGAAPPASADIIEELELHGAVFGIDYEAIEKILLRRDYGRQFPAAQGKAPVNGKPARIEYHFNINRGKPYLEMEFGRINLKELNFIENRSEGDLLAELLPPVKEEHGRTVTGDLLTASTETASVELISGQNTRLSDDRKSLYAACDGNVKLDKGTVIVEPVVTVKNVNYETGNIYFEGSVVVKGSIADGFIVEADGDIQVGKGVGKASLRAGGNILLKTGINGNNEGKIECGGDLYAKYIESSTVVTRGNVFVEEAIMHSRLLVWKHCVFNGRRSEFIAGTLIVGGSLWCKKLGNLYEAPTHIAIGIPPDLLTAYRQAKQKLSEKQEAVNKADEQFMQFEKAVSEGSTDERVLTAREQLSGLTAELTGEIEELRKTVSQLREQLRASRQSMLIVEEMMYKGVTVTFGTLEYRVPDNGARKTILKAGESGIAESGFNPHERPKLNFEMETSAAETEA